MIMLLKVRYNSKFILMATAMGTNALVVTRDLCITNKDNKADQELVSLCSPISMIK